MNTKGFKRKLTYKEGLAAEVAKEFADEFQPIMICILKKYGAGDKNGLLQGESLCDFAAFLLSITLKSLKMAKASDEMMLLIMQNCIEKAYFMAEKGTFHKVGEH